MALPEPFLFFTRRDQGGIDPETPRIILGLIDRRSTEKPPGPVPPGPSQFPLAAAFAPESVSK